jgi:hypothetical protein
VRFVQSREDSDSIVKHMLQGMSLTSVFASRCHAALAATCADATCSTNHADASLHAALENAWVGVWGCISSPARLLRAHPRSPSVQVNNGAKRGDGGEGDA